MKRCVAKTVDQINREKLLGISVDNEELLTPTEIADFKREEAEFIAAEKATEYARFRLREYPPIGDQLDAIWKAIGQIKQDGTTLPSIAVSMLTTVMAVKEKFPKPVKEEKENA